MFIPNVHGGHGTKKPLTGQYQDAGVVGSDSYQFNILDVDVGEVASDRYVAVAVGLRTNTSGATLDAVTIGGVSANIVVQYNIASSDWYLSAIAIAAVPNGTLADIVVECSAYSEWAYVASYPLYGLESATPVDTAFIGGTVQELSFNLDIAEGGFAVAALSTNKSPPGTQFTWTGLNKDLEVTIEAEGFSAASMFDMTEETARSISFNPNVTSNRHSLVAASFR